MHTPRLVPIALVAACLGVAACSSEGESGTVATATATTTASSAPTAGATANATAASTDTATPIASSPPGSGTPSANATAVPTATVRATSTNPPDATVTPAALAVYEDALERRVRIEYPATWTLDPDYGVQFSGDDGFIQVSDLGNDAQGLDAAVDAIAHHRLMPYGSNPTLETVTVDGAEAVLIRPSDDQLPPGSSSPRHVAVVIPRGEPLLIDGQSYEYLVLYMDEANASALLASVVLLPPK